jgi:hypothetical protein
VAKLIDEDETADWASQEFAQANLGDARLSRRLVALARQLAARPQTSLLQALAPAALKAAYRFFDNDQVDTEGVLAPHVAQTLHRMQALPVVLAIQDTTEFNLGHLGATRGVGYLSGNGGQGFMMHSLLAVSPEGLPLGVLAIKTWARPMENLGCTGRRKARTIQDKESIKWLQGLERLAALKGHCPATQLVAVGDRESDVYELFARPRPPAARTARLKLRYAPVRLQPPKARASHLPELDVLAIHVIEEDAPAGVQPLEWMLLSSVPTDSAEQALERLSWYAQRWTIETWHRVIKSGCRIEARQFGTLERFVRATALFAVIAWRILYSTLLARLDGQLSCEVVLQPLQWQALYCRVHRTDRPPDQAPCLRQAMLWIARLGGYLNRPHDRPPGATVIWRGFLALHEITQMFSIFRPDS